jgi:biopolymer transport protein ExbB/TolQ
MNRIVDVLYLCSTILLVPVLLLLLLLVVYCLLQLGGLLQEWRARRREASPWQVALRSVAMQADRADDASVQHVLQSGQTPGFVSVFASRVVSDAFQSELTDKHASDVEIECAGRLAGLSLMIRVGPMLGLMGTLIPLGPALVGLSQGNLPSMASDLVVAFSTTVLGLLVGGIAYLLWAVRRQWYAQDLSDIDFVCRLLSTGRIETDHLSTGSSHDGSNS